MHAPLELAWRELNRELLRRLGPERYATWIRHVRPVSFDEESFVFHFPETSVKEKIEGLVRGVVAEAARRVTNRNVRVSFVVEGHSFAPAASAPPRTSAPARGVRPPSPVFEAFVSGRGNRMALAAARSFAGTDRAVFRSLLLYGPSGLGKSHLLKAIGTEAARRTPGLDILQFTGDRFVRQFVEAHYRGQAEAFLHKCRRAQLFLLDDLHLLCGKTEAQSALLQTILALEERGCRVALTSEKHPRALEGLARNVRNRLRLEMEVALERPDVTTCTEVLKASAPPGTPPLVLEYIAAHVQSSHMDQLHCLSRLLDQGAPTSAAVRAVVADFLNRWSRGLTYEDIARAAADSFGVSVSEIYSFRRTRSAAGARQACFYLARKLLKHPFSRIGDHFGGRDHATVLQACKKLEGQDGETRERLLRMERELHTFVPHPPMMAR